MEAPKPEPVEEPTPEKDSERIANLETAVKLIAERCDQLLALVGTLAEAGQELTVEVLRNQGASEAEIQEAIAKGKAQSG